MTNSDPLRTAVLGGLLGSIAFVAYFAVLITPLQSEATRLRAEMSRADERMRTAGLELKKLRSAEAAEQAESAADALVEHLAQTVPETYQVTCPAEISKALKAHGVEGARTRLHMIEPSREVSRNVVTVWEVEMPLVHPFRVGEVLADMENRFPLGKMRSVSLAATPGSDGVKAQLTFDIAAQK